MNARRLRKAENIVLIDIELRLIRRTLAALIWQERKGSIDCLKLDNRFNFRNVTGKKRNEKEKFLNP